MNQLHFNGIEPAPIKSEIEKILEEAESVHRDITLVDGYAKPGYPDGPVALSNWNETSHYDERFGKHVTDDDTMPRLAKRLEELGYHIDWDDEYDVCSDCGRAVRSTGDSYSWSKYSWYSEDTGDILCGDCVQKDPDEYLASLSGNPRACLTIPVDLDEHGYELLEDDFANGLYGGQCSDPEAIAESLKALGVTDFIFVLDSVGQFDCHFSVWVYKTALTRDLKAKWESANKRCKIDPAEAMRRALQAGTELARKLPGDGIKVIKCNTDGTATAKTVSAQDFIDGKALD